MNPYNCDAGDRLEPVPMRRGAATWGTGALEALLPLLPVLPLLPLLPLTCLALCLASPRWAYAQQGAPVVDLFDGQTHPEPSGAKAPAVPIVVESTMGLSTGSGGTGLGSATPGRALELGFERRAAGIYVLVRIEGRDVAMLLDTGASYTTLTSAFAASIGALPSANAPRTMVNTANGSVESSFGQINRLDLGGRVEDHVTFLVCDTCTGPPVQGRPVVGLLGLNVLRRYRMSLDDARSRVELEPGLEYLNRQWDARPWVEAQVRLEQRLVKDRRRIWVEVSVTSRSAWTLESLRYRARCQEPGGRWLEAELKLGRLAPGRLQRATAPFDAATCRAGEVDLVEARW